MTRLSEALEALGLAAEVALAGRWAKLQGERCAVYVTEGPWSAGFYSWCEDPLDRSVEHFSDPTEAIEAGLRRASRQQDRAVGNRAWREKESTHDGDVVDRGGGSDGRAR